MANPAIVAKPSWLSADTHPAYQMFSATGRKPVGLTGEMPVLCATAFASQAMVAPAFHCELLILSISSQRFFAVCASCGFTTEILPSRTRK